MKVLSRMLSTGRALGGGGRGLLEHPNPLVPVPAPLSPLSPHPLYLSRATFSAKLPTRRSG